MTIGFVCLLVCSAIFSFIWFTKYKEIQDQYTHLQESYLQMQEAHTKWQELETIIETNKKEITLQQETINSQKEELLGVNNWIAAHRIAAENIQKSIDEALAQEQLARQKAQSAAELADKDFQIEAAQRRDAFERQIQIEFEELERNSPRAALQIELNGIKSQIEEARNTLILQQTQMMERLKEEDFINFHSINLTEDDINDIKLIREFEPRLNRREAFRKLIWTEFIQKQIQGLCKTLGVDKLKGIYKITNIKDGRAYVGQSVNISDRWKAHCKAALGIDSNSYQTNKFYKAMHDEGIENFTFEVLESGDIDLNAREFYWIDFYNTTTFGYNSKAGG